MPINSQKIEIFNFKTEQNFKSFKYFIRKMNAIERNLNITYDLSHRFAIFESTQYIVISMTHIILFYIIFRLYFYKNFLKMNSSGAQQTVNYYSQTIPSLSFSESQSQPSKGSVSRDCKIKDLIIDFRFHSIIIFFNIKTLFRVA